MDRKFANLVESFGIIVNEVLKLAGLPEDLFIHKIPSLSSNEYIRFMLALRELSNDESLPIKIGTADNLETFSPPVFAAYCSKNTLTCMKRLATYKKLIGPLLFLVNEHKDEITLEMTFENKADQLPEFLVAIEMVFLIQLMRNATKKHIIPKKVMTNYNLNSDDYESFFGVRPVVGPRNVLTISRKDALIPFISQNDAMWEYFEPELRRRLCELDADDSYTTKLGCSKRTLQRNLKEEDTNFQKQLNTTRELLARHYLKNSDMASTDIAYLLGYQDINSFVRAFHKWTGMTISEYRRGL